MKPRTPFPSWTALVVLAFAELLVAFGAALLSLPWASVVGAPVLVGLFGWLWPRQPAETDPVVEKGPVADSSPGEQNGMDDRDDWRRQAETLAGELALVRFRFQEAGEFATRSLGGSEVFARGEVQSILRGFRTLETTASSIESGVAASFRSMTSPEAPQSLVAIARQSETIAEELKDFFADLGVLEDRTLNYLKSNYAELEKVSAMATNIEEFFESIRMISLNLSIEASRAGSGPAGKAFQVLAQRLRDFSTQAQQISETQRAIIQRAGQVLGGSETELKQSFEALADRIPPIRGQLDPFAAIVQNTRTQLDEVLGRLAQMSVAVKGMLTNEIGQLQFQDLTRQEYEHLAQLLRWAAQKDGETEPVSPDAALHERVALAKEFNRMITTSNESQVLEAYLGDHQVPAEAVVVKGSSRSPGTVELF